MTLVCRKSERSTALEYDTKASNSQVSLVETNLMGVDKTSGKASWFFVDSQGGTGLDHVKWTNADTITMERSRKTAPRRCRTKVSSPSPEMRSICAARSPPRARPPAFSQRI